MTEMEISVVDSCSLASVQHAGKVLVSGSYGGKYNAYNAAKWGVRGVIMHDAGIGKDGAGIRGLDYLSAIGLPGAVADGWTCRIGDGADVLLSGVISVVNDVAASFGCAPNQSACHCAGLMRSAAPSNIPLPAITEGGRFPIARGLGKRRLVCIDTAGVLGPEDTGAIVVTGSHAALPSDNRNGLNGSSPFALFFSDGGVGKDGAGIARVFALDKMDIIAGAVSAASAPIGDSRAIYAEGVLSSLNQAAFRRGGQIGMTLKAFIHNLPAD